MLSLKRSVRAHYAAHRRSMPWRDRPPGRSMTDEAWAYRIVVSEIMLQQTQVSRVMHAYGPFIERFPDWRSLARASTAEILAEWSGLGYNRRALCLKRIAETVTRNGARAGRLPRTYDGLRALPGIGPNTAGSILAFAFGIPHPFIETNIRAVFLHVFFPHTRRTIADAELMPIIETALLDDRTNRLNPRDWYYALMDYGAYLKSAESGLPNPSRRSKHHVRQSPFKGSTRELRSHILKMVMHRPASLHDIEMRFAPAHPPERIHKSLADLVREGFITPTKGICKDIYTVA